MPNYYYLRDICRRTAERLIVVIVVMTVVIWIIVTLAHQAYVQLDTRSMATHHRPYQFVTYCCCQCISYQAEYFTSKILCHGEWCV